MRPTDYIASLFKPSGGPGGESAAYDFDPIGSYFYNCPAEEGVFQIVDAETTADLDLNAVLKRSTARPHVSASNTSTPGCGRCGARRIPRISTAGSVLSKTTTN